jgi:hypothetical protein
MCLAVITWRNTVLVRMRARVKGKGKKSQSLLQLRAKKINRQRCGARTRHLRHLEMATCSALLAGFDDYCEKASSDTKTGQTDEWSKAGARSEHFYRVCKDIPHPKLKKSEQLLKVIFLTSPFPHVVLQIIKLENPRTLG